MKVAKWGNSLAVRLPASLVVELGLKEGDEIEMTAIGNRRFEVSVDRLREERLERMRALRVPWPEGYVFNREELYERADREPGYLETEKKSDDKGAAAD